MNTVYDLILWVLTRIAPPEKDTPLPDQLNLTKENH